MSALRDWAERTRRSSAVPAPELTPPGHQLHLLLSAERQRIASALHDEVGPLLFGMAGQASRVRQSYPNDPAQLLAAIEQFTEQLAEVQQRLRSVISACGPTAEAEAVPAATQRELDAFTARTGTTGHLLVQGRPEHLPAPVEHATLNCLRQALFNVERHADAAVVVVTLDYRPDRLRLVVQDDGLGLPAGFEPRAIPSEGHHWGFSSMAEQVERLGGSVELRQVEEGGAQLRLQLPRALPATAEAS